MGRMTNHWDAIEATPARAAAAGPGLLMLFALGYGVATFIGDALPGEPTSFAAFWPGSGVMLAALLLSPARRWWVYALIAILVSTVQSALLFNKPVWFSAAFGIGDAVEAVVAATVYRRLFGQERPDLRLKSFLCLTLLAAPAGVLLGGLLNGTNAWLLTGSEWHRCFVTEAIGDYLGILVVGVLILTFAPRKGSPRGPGWTAARLAEAVALGGVLVAALWAVFSAPQDSPLAKTYPISLAFLWVTLRFGLPGVSLGSVALAGVAVWFGSRGLGPMVAPNLDPWSATFLLQIYLCSSSLTYLTVAVLHAEQSLADARLREAARFSDAVFENAPVAIEARDTACRLLRRNEASRNSHGSAFARPNGSAELFQRALAGETVIQEGAAQHEQGKGCQNIPGQQRYFDRFIYPIRDEAGAVVAAVSFARDVTQRQEADERLRAALRERETLLKEVHHRVKNNLAITVSLLNFQIRKAPNQAVVGPLREAQGRVRAMALVHELLYRSDSLATFSLPEYVDVLTRTLVGGFSPAGQIRTEVHAAATLPLDAAVPFGLILNELVSNACKHAFPDGQHGTLGVSVTEEGGRFHLAVADDGVGMPPEVEPATTRTLGLRLVRSLTQQLGGSLEFVRSGGTTVHVRFSDSQGEAK